MLFLHGQLIKRTLISKANFAGHPEDLVLNGEMIIKFVLNFKQNYQLRIFRV
jgi:hypothetical protein